MYYLLIKFENNICLFKNTKPDCELRFVKKHVYDHVKGML